MACSLRLMGATTYGRASITDSHAGEGSVTLVPQVLLLAVMPISSFFVRRSGPSPAGPRITVDVAAFSPSLTTSAPHSLSGGLAKELHTDENGDS